MSLELAWGVQVRSTFTLTLIDKVGPNVILIE